MRELEDLTGGDAKAVRRATRLKVSNGGLEEISMGLGDDKMDALLTRVITSWDVRSAKGEPLGLPQFDNTALDQVPLDVYNLLVEAAEPLMNAVDGAGKATTPNEIGSSDTSSPATLQASVISQAEQSTAPSSGDGSPNGGTGLPPSPMSSPSPS